jgi:two-component system, cell cycle response regulator
VRRVRAANWKGASTSASTLLFDGRFVMNPSTATILLVSRDRVALRRLTTALATTGCRVQQTSQKEQAAALLAADPPDLLILDTAPSLRQTLGLLQIADSDRQGRCPYTLVIVGNPTREDLVAAVEAGANDFLTKPVASGELLARVRAGKCFRQCERRLLDMGGSHTVTGLPGFAAFEHRLRRELSRPGRKAGTPSLVAVDIDFYQSVLRLHGETAGTAVLRATGKALRDAANGSASVYALGADRFAAILPGVAEDGAASWADRARQVVAEMEYAAKGQTLRITASCGVAGGTEEEDPQRLIWNVLDALRSAKSSGRDCTARFGEFAAESAADDVVTPVKLLQDSVARDIFIPCSVELRAEDRLADAEALFRRTRLPAFPVVDGKGEVVGILTDDAVHAPHTVGAAAKVVELMSVDVTKFDEWTDFLTLLQYFAQHPEAVAIVVRNGRPTGLLTSDCLVTPVDSMEEHPVGAGDPMACEHVSEVPVLQGSAEV